MAQTLQEFLLLPIPKVPDLIGRGILPEQGRMIVGGEPKTNKSWVALSMALAMARGKPVFGAHYPQGAPILPVKHPYRILYIEQEIGPVKLQERLRGLCTGEADLAQLELYIKSKDLELRLDTPEGCKALFAEVEAVEPDCVILDTLSKFHASEENSSQDMGVIMLNCQKMTIHYDTALILIHHTGKPNPEFPKRGGDRLRGSSAIFADVDTCCIVSRLSSESAKEPVLELDFELRCGEPLEKLYVKRLASGEVVHLGSGFVPPPPPSAKRRRGRGPHQVDF